MQTVHGEWCEALKDELSSAQFQKTMSWVRQAYDTGTVYPARGQVFRALELTPYSKVRVCILGQDPYHSTGVRTDSRGEPMGIAHGLAFSVPRGEAIPPSLKNIYREISEEYGLTAPDCGDLTAWAEQGVLLLNTTLTVQAGKAGSHRKFGWSRFTDGVIKSLNQKETPVVFLLWGNDAIRKKELITNPNHLILTAPHPSPLSAYRGFFGCGHFKACNEFLQKNGMEPIVWFS